jgi:FkbM family methyltransferase
LLHRGLTASAPAILDPGAIARLPRGIVEQASRRLVSPLYLGDEVALCRVLTRYKMYIDARDQDFGAHLLVDGYWESWATQFVARTVRPGWTVADVGANHGYYALLLADLVGPSGRVFAIEPNPSTAALMKRSLALNGFAARSTVCEVAAGGPGEGEGSLWVPEWSPGHAALSPIAEAPPGMASFKVPVATLDSLIGAGRRLDFLKIDAEGAEERVVAGMERLIAHRPAMVLEFAAGRYADPAAFVDRLAAVYGAVREVGQDGRARPVDRQRLLTERPMEERLLFLSAS